MASQNNVPRDILDSIRDVLDRRIKLSIKRLVNCEVRKEKWENRVLAFSTCRLFVFTAKAPTKECRQNDVTLNDVLDTSFHYLDIQAIESKTPNQLVLSLENKSYTFTTLESGTEEVNHMVTHIGTSLKTVFPAFPLERLIKKVEVQPPDRLRVMYDMMQQLETRETGPCGGFTLMYACMCDYHGLTYRDEVAWDVDTIYLSQDCRQLCLRDFDHLMSRDLVPIISALVHNPWFTVLNANNVRLAPEVCVEILHVMKKNSVIESLLLSNTGINIDFLIKLSTSILSMSATQLQKLDLSDNPLLDDKGITHIIGSLSSLGKPFMYLDLSRTKLSTKGLSKVAETMSRSPHVFSSLQVLKLADISSSRAEDLQMLYSFLAQPNMISQLDLSGTDCELDRLMVPLQRGCSRTITTLKLSRVAFTNKRIKDIVVQSSFKKFFATVYALKHLDLTGCKLPPDAIKELLLGLGSNRNLAGIHLDLSGVDLQNQGAQNLQSCLAGIHNIVSLNISNIAFQDADLCNVLNSIGQNKNIKHLAIGDVFQKIKSRNLNSIMEELVHVIQDDDSVLESLSLADSRLKGSMNLIINALGSNSSLTVIDISGNQMGDLGARMLSKALQINNKLKTISWDKNNTTAQGFEDIAEALEKNYTLKKMPLPVYDASTALKVQPERTEAALQAIEGLLQRNHSPQKYSSDQAYRLQQGFLISSTQQMVDRLVVQSQDTINALSIDLDDSYTPDINIAKSIIADADNSKLLLPKLHDIAIESQNAGNPVQEKLQQISQELKAVLDAQMKATVKEMLQSTQRQCSAITSDKAFLTDLQTGCTEKSGFPKDFATNVLDGVDTDIFNKLSELNLAVAAHVSDTVLDAVIERLSHTHKTLTNHLNLKKKNVLNKRTSRPEKVDADKEKTDEPSTKVATLALPRLTFDSPHVQSKRKSMLARKLRPQSVINILDCDITDSSSNTQTAKPKRHVDPAVTAHVLDDLSEASSPKKTPAAIQEVEDLDIVPDLPPAAPRLNCVTKDRPKRPKNRPATRQSALPGRVDTLTNKDNDIDSFFENQSPVLPPVTSRKGKKETVTSRKDKKENQSHVAPPIGSKKDKEEQTDKDDSNKGTPETKKKSGLFHFATNKEKIGAGLTNLFKKPGKKPNHRVSSAADDVADGHPPPESCPGVTTANDSSKNDTENKTTVDTEFIPENKNTNNNDIDLDSKTEDSISIDTGNKTKEVEKTDKKPLELPKIKKSSERSAGVDQGDETLELRTNGVTHVEPEITEQEKNVTKDIGSQNEVVVKDTEDIGGSEKVNPVKEETSEENKEDEKKEEDEVGAVKDDKVDEPKPNTDPSEPSPSQPEPPVDHVELPAPQDGEPAEEETAPKAKKSPGLGFGVDIMAQLKQKQEKRKSMMPAPKVSDNSPEEKEKPFPFGMKNLKSVGDRNKVPIAKKADFNTPVPTDSKAATVTNAPHTPETASKERVVSDKNKATPTQYVKATKAGEGTRLPPKQQTVVKESPANEGTGVTPTHQAPAKEDKPAPDHKPADAPKPAVLPRPPPQARPKRPPSATKPKPAPRKSLSASEEAELNTSLETSLPNVDEKKDEGGVFDDSDTSKLSVKDKISKFRKSDSDAMPAKNNDLVTKDTKPKTGSLPSNAKHPDTSKPGALNKDRLSSDKTDGSRPERKSWSPGSVKAGELDVCTENNKEMTDSGIGDDADTIKLSVRDKANRFSMSAADTGINKSGSLTRDVKPADLFKEMDGSPKRPQSMLALVKKQREEDAGPASKPDPAASDKEGEGTSGTGDKHTEVYMV